MRPRLVSALLLSVLVASGLAGAVGVTAAWTRHHSAARSTITEHPTGTRNGTVLLTRAELFAALDEDGTDANATLYYVAENGTWYHASSNGSVGVVASEGDVVPGIADETYDVPPDDRPRFLWKVVRDGGCDTGFYDASNGTSVATYVVPSCPPPPPPTPGTSTAVPVTTNEDATTTSESGTAPTDTSSTGGQPGFGAAVGALGIVVALWFARRR